MWGLNVRLHYRLSYGGSYKFSQISLRISSFAYPLVWGLNVRLHYRLSYGGISVICSDFSEITSKIQSNVRYLNVRSHYRLSYGGICVHLFRCIFSGDSCVNRPSASPLMARITDAHRFELKTVHRTVFLTLKPSRVRFRKHNQYHNVISWQRTSSFLVTRAGIEPALPAWEAGVLTAWPTSHFSRDSLLWAPCFWCTIRGSNPGHPD